MKRLFDLSVSLVVLALVSPFLLIFAFLVWVQDFHSPLYVAKRVGLDGLPFNMYKLRSMVVNADSTGVDSTSNHDQRITAVGRLIRKFKLDELTQLINVVDGSMSLVGPRPNVARETDLYTDLEMKLLTVKPGITDFASIVFADEGEVLADSADPDLEYNQVIRPLKSELGLFYIEHKSIVLDVKLCITTAVAILDRPKALSMVGHMLDACGADRLLVERASRIKPLERRPPPGADDLVRSR